MMRRRMFLRRILLVRGVRVKMSEEEREEQFSPKAEGFCTLEELLKIPIELGGMKVKSDLDSMSDFLLVEKMLWEKMEGEFVDKPVCYQGIVGGGIFCQRGKRVKLRCGDCSVEEIAYPMIKNKYTDVLIPLETLGVSLRGIPTKFKSEVEKKKGGGDVSGIG